MTQTHSRPGPAGPEAAITVGETYEQGTGTRALRKALRYADAGWPVFPCHWTTRAGCSCGDTECHSPGKHPLTRRGLHDASTDPAVITAWWTRCPAANVAIATGAPGPDVLDFDVKNDAPGAASLARLRDAGLLVGAHSIITTWSGGWHLYYVGSEQGNGSIRGHGVDFRSRGGYVLAPPSVINGKPYALTEWRSRLDPAVTGVDFATIRRALDPPRTFTSRARPGERSDHGALVRHVAGQAEGNRNGALFWAACRAVETGADEQVFTDLLDAALSVGLTDRAAAATIASARCRIGASA
ncbi:bifunctional DNA primase/polymerase [Micromonospora sp. NPDC050695]|uniref:bifunctional DNA primase/polymerase n=1 Tax=Micromonospora sp. NPDC050695 TaxID=3154938 RepID=UPI0033D683AE